MEVSRSRYSLGNMQTCKAVQFIETGVVQHLLELYSIALLLMEEGGAPWPGSG